MRERIAAVLVAVAVVTVIGYRVLAPAETRTGARSPYPSVDAATPGITGELLHAPLLVDGRLRVYAAKRQVWADSPIGARTETTPYWSLRRWPHEVVGVVGVVSVSGPLVVSKWSDGVLVAMDARTGGEAWRAPSSIGARHYGGGRTGASTVYAPADLHTGRTADGRTIVLSTGSTGTAAFDAARGGSPLWTAPIAVCAGFTGPGFYADCAGNRFDVATGARLSSLPTRAEPLGCAIGRSGCTAIRSGADAWLLDDGEPVAAPGLAPAGMWRVGNLAVGPSPSPTGVVEARSVRDGTPQWTWRSPEGDGARIAAMEPGAVYLITERHMLVVLDPRTGLELTGMSLLRPRVRTPPWAVGHVHVRDRYVIVERLDDLVRPVLVAGRAA